MIWTIWRSCVCTAIRSVMASHHLMIIGEIIFQYPLNRNMITALYIFPNEWIASYVKGIYPYMVITDPHVCTCVHACVSTILPQIKAQAFISFQQFSPWPLNKTGNYMRPTFISTRSKCCVLSVSQQWILMVADDMQSTSYCILWNIQCGLWPPDINIYNGGK